MSSIQTSDPNHTPRPLSKQLIIILAAGFFVTGIVVAALLHYWYQIGPISPRSTTGIQDEKAAQPELVCEDGWSTYEREAIGLGFCYPDAWGNAMLVDAKLIPSDKGNRWLVKFEKKPAVSVGVVSNDWSTEVGRGGVCSDPAKDPPDYASFSMDWTVDGEGQPHENVYRGLDVRPAYYLAEESASEFLGGVCLRGIAQIRNIEYPVVTAAYYREFGAGITSPQSHKNNPTILASVDDRSDFLQLVRYLQAL